MDERASRLLFICQNSICPNILAHPAWLTSFLLDGGVPRLENIVIPGKGPMDLLDVGSALSDSTVTWADLKWIRQLWPDPSW